MCSSHTGGISGYTHPCCIKSCIIWYSVYISWTYWRNPFYWLFSQPANRWGPSCLCCLKRSIPHLCHPQSQVMWRWNMQVSTRVSMQDSMCSIPDKQCMLGERVFDTCSVIVQATIYGAWRVCSLQGEHIVSQRDILPTERGTDRGWGYSFWVWWCHVINLGSCATATALTILSWITYIPRVTWCLEPGITNFRGWWWLICVCVTFLCPVPFPAPRPQGSGSFAERKKNQVCVSVRVHGTVCAALQGVLLHIFCLDVLLFGSWLLYVLINNLHTCVCVFWDCCSRVYQSITTRLLSNC